MTFNVMSAALSVLLMRNFSKIFLRAPRALEFSHGLDPQQSFRPDADAAAQTRLFDGLLNDPGSLRLGEHRHEHS